MVLFSKRTGMLSYNSSLFVQDWLYFEKLNLNMLSNQDPIARKVINKGTYSENLVVEIITKELKIFKYNCTEFKVMNFSEVDTIGKWHFQISMKF